LKGVRGQTQQHLNQIRTIHLQLNVFREGLDEELMLSDAGMEFQKLPKIGEDLVDAHLRGCRGIFAEKTEIPPRNVDAVSELPGDSCQSILDDFQVLACQGGCATDSLADDLDKT